MKFKYLKEYSNFEKHPEEKYQKIINSKEKVSKKKEIDILSDSGFDEGDLKKWPEEDVADMFRAWKEDSKKDLKEEKEETEEIDPDLRDEK